VRERIAVYEKQFLYYKELSEKAIDQMETKYLFDVDSEVSNSIAVIMKHLAGNMLSRWTNVFDSDGEKSWRNRDQEFVDTFADQQELMTYWNQGWACLFGALEGMKDSDLDRVIYIRNMGCSVHDAIIRQLCHYPYHIGQMVYIARASVGSDFEPLSIPAGKSEVFNAMRFAKDKTMKHFTDDV